MCGIAGWIAGGSSPPDRAILSRMADAMAHRGPDAEGVLVVGEAGLVHRRLSVVDLSTTNNQPMVDTTGRWNLVFNGEIYNFQELRRELEGRGVVFHTHGDTEVLLEALKAWGPTALERCNGMFAFALWDAQTHELLIGRDRLGKKPLFYARLPDGGFAFASEPRTLAVHPAIGARIDPAALAQYLRLNYVPCNRSLIAGIESLPPACWARATVGKPLQVTPYWDLAAKFRDKRPFASIDDAAQELAALIDDAVRVRLVSDVPLGAFLSGGVDSSTIVASMRHLRDGNGVFTFTSGFVEDSFDESPTAERMAAHLGVVHRTQRLDIRSVDLLPAVVAAAGEPLADTSALPMYLLSKFTRESVTVALSGDGGDECFAGYETYVADKIHGALGFVPRALRGSAHGVLDRILPVNHRKLGLPEKLRRFSAALAQPFERAHASWRDIFAEGELKALMPQAAQAADEASRSLFDSYFAEHFDAVRGCNPVDQATYVDIKTWMVDDILVKADRMSMASSLEVRCPLLDHRVVEFAAQLPPDMKLRGFDKKHLLKRSQRQRVPEWILHRKKQGFNAPVSQWVLGPLRELCHDTLSSAAMREWFDRDALERLWREHESLQRDNGLRLFGLMCAGLFLQQTRQAAATNRASRANLNTAQGV